MIYKDLFKIKIDGKEYTEENRILPKDAFDINELRNIYLDNRDSKIELIYVPILTEDILSDEEIYGWDDNDNDYDYFDYEREEEDYED